MDEYIQVFTTIDNNENAEKIAKTLVEERLAACVQIIGPITSFYWWKNKLEKSEEWLCIIKSRKSIYNKLEKRIREVHTYEVPEIIAMPITYGYSEYLNWIRDETKDK